MILGKYGLDRKEPVNELARKGEVEEGAFDHGTKQRRGTIWKTILGELSRIELSGLSTYQ